MFVINLNKKKIISKNKTKDIQHMVHGQDLQKRSDVKVTHLLQPKCWVKQTEKAVAKEQKLWKGSAEAALGAKLSCIYIC